ncbi:MAG: type II toxin-antitoxin system RelE/ParE family toxin [Proteobacteria bacterium]|nr:type II toxin-antitoxin system RelE/ParE family toxin [Pseudomonadota bacterium]
MIAAGIDQFLRCCQIYFCYRLAFLHAAVTIDDMNIPGYRLHQLKGELEGHWAIDVNKNWRIVFRFEDGDAYVVNYEDYH